MNKPEKITEKPEFDQLLTQLGQISKKGPSQSEELIITFSKLMALIPSLSLPQLEQLETALDKLSSGPKLPPSK